MWLTHVMLFLSVSFLSTSLYLSVSLCLFVAHSPIIISLFSFLLLLLCNRLHLPCGKHPRIKMFCSDVVTSKYILTCAYLDTRCDGPLVSCSQTLILVTPKNFAALAMVSTLSALAPAQLTVSSLWLVAERVTFALQRCCLSQFLH